MFNNNNNNNHNILRVSHHHHHSNNNNLNKCLQLRVSSYNNSKDFSKSK